jgi:hypothetical protein
LCIKYSCFVLLACLLLLCGAQVERIETEKLKAVGLRNRVAAMQEVSAHYHKGRQSLWQHGNWQALKGCC